MVKEIKLNKGLVALVDDDDYEWLNQWKWYAKFSRNDIYAVRVVKEMGKQRMLIMHRLIVAAPAGYETDHWDGNGLNNVRSNLRSCTTSQNQANVGMWAHNTIGLKGVIWDGRWRKPWQARIQVNSRRIYLGSFATKEEAGLAYNEAASKYFGEFACLNPISGLQPSIIGSANEQPQ